MMRKIMNKLFIVAVFTLVAAPSWAIDSADSADRKSPVKRSMTGGSPMADVLKRGDDKSSSDESTRAMIAPEKITDAKKDKVKRRVPLARSGGSPSSSFATIDRSSDVK